MTDVWGKIMQVQIDSARYLGEKRSYTIKNIRFSVSPREMIGLIGTNGAGKSTTLQSILGLMPEMSGEIIFPTSEIPYAYVPEQPIYYDYLTLQEHFDLLYEMHQLTERTAPDELENLLEQFNLTQVRKQYISSFSKGMKQKAAFLFAYIQKPDILILDEPFVGLDAMSMKLVLRLLEKQRQLGMGILLCTHVLDTAEKICGRFVWIHGGEMLKYATLEQLQQEAALENGGLMDCM